MTTTMAMVMTVTATRGARAVDPSAGGPRAVDLAAGGVAVLGDGGYQYGAQSASNSDSVGLTGHMLVVRPALQANQTSHTTIV